MRVALAVMVAALALSGCHHQAAVSAERDAATEVPNTVHGASPVLADAGEWDAGTLAVADAGGDAGAQTGLAHARASRYLVKDNKVRCIQAPCMSLDALPIDSSEPTQRISDVDFAALGVQPNVQEKLMAQLFSKGLKVEGVIEDGPKGRGGAPSRVLKVQKLLSPVENPGPTTDNFGKTPPIRPPDRAKQTE